MFILFTGAKIIGPLSRNGNKIQINLIENINNVSIKLFKGK